LAALDKIVEKLSLKQNVYGPLYKLFDVEEVYQTAVEIIGGSSLFHVVVDNDETATKILQQMNREKSGRVTFMPLNRLKPKATTYPSTTDAIPMIQKLKFNEQYKVAFEQVSHQWLICRSLEKH
jgi:structural maintenance of chromosome 3 (chondroitin sulfate proteoglycan 6)